MKVDIKLTPTIGQVTEFILFGNELFFRGKYFDNFEMYIENKQLFELISPRFFEFLIPQRIEVMINFIKVMAEDKNLITPEKANELIQGVHFAEKVFWDGLIIDRKIRKNLKLGELN